MNIGFIWASFPPLTSRCVLLVRHSSVPTRPDGVKTCFLPVFDLSRRDVLVDPEEVVRVVLLLDRLQPVELLRSVRLAHAIRALVPEEVDVHALVPRRELVPE